MSEGQTRITDHPTGQVRSRNIPVLVILIIAGEAIFSLPFIVPRVFRPTVLNLFQIDNTELGIWFSIYGVVAMFSYLFGGILADRFQARNLMAIALWMTSLGGFIAMWIPSPAVMRVVYGLWGFTSIFLFWAALIKATRNWGGGEFQGRAFGWLEGGRGGVSALLGTITFLLFFWATPEADVAAASGRNWQGLQVVFLTVSLFTLLSGILVWYLVPVWKEEGERVPRSGILREVSVLSKKPTIWLLAVIIICAYSGYKITDDFSLYAREVLAFTEVGAAGVGSAALWLRAAAAVVAGIIADRFHRLWIIFLSFVLTLGGSILVGTGIWEHVTGLALLKLAFTATGIYALRALYFAVLKEVRVELYLTGTAVGIISFAGYTPEVFMGPWMGILLDQSPGAGGHRHVFLLLSAFALVGLISVSLLIRLVTRRQS